MATSKKQVLKKLLSLTLVVVMFWGFIPIPAQAVSTPATLTNGMPVTEENVLALIEEYRNGKEPGEKAKNAGFTSYTNGSTYDAYNPTYYIAGLGNGKECAKFAFAFWDDIFGDVPYRKVTNLWQVRPGDLVCSPGHWFVAVKSSFPSSFHNDPCTQSVGGGKAGSIGWGDPGWRLDSDTIVYTRYPLPYSFTKSIYEFFITDSPLGSALSDITPATLHCYAGKEGEPAEEFNIPIIWDEAGEYKPWEHGTQTISGRLDISNFPELEGSELPTVTADISLEGSIGVTNVSVAAPGMITAKYGTSWADLNAPDRLTATITYADDSTETEDVGVVWDFLSYGGQIGTQTIRGTIQIDGSNYILNDPEMSEWAEKLRNDGVELTILIQNTGTGVTVLGEPFEATGFLGDAFSALNGVPSTVMVNPQLASGTATEPWEVMVNWDTSAYDPLKEEQTITGKLNFSGFVEEFPETTVTLHISLAINPNEAVDSITLISPLTISGVLGVAFDQQPLPEKVTVRITYASGRTAELEANVSWDGSGFDANSNGDQQVPGTVSFSNGEIPDNTDPAKLIVTTSINLQIRGTGITVEEITPLKGYLGASVDEFRSRAPTVNDVEVPVQRTAYLVSDDSAVENPTAAGKYQIHSVLPDGYLWEGTTSQERDETVWIYPVVSPIYVSENLSNSGFETGNGAYSFSFGANPDFDSSTPGTKTVSVIAAGGEFTEVISLDIDVLSWTVTGKQTAEAAGKYGTTFDALNLPATVKVTAMGRGDEQEFDVPVTWSDASYNSYAEVQTIEGILNFSSIPQLSGQMDATASAVIRLSMNEVTAPVIADFIKTYDETSSPMSAPALPDGIESCSISYSGTSFAGNAYGPSADAPVNAGEYTATVSFTMANGYAQLPAVEVPYTINKASQAAPAFIELAASSYDSIVLRPVDGAEYSRDGVAWQSVSSFYGLTANTEYTMYIRMPATADGNYNPSDSLTLSVTTSKRDAQAPSLATRTVTYSGEPQAYTVAAITGVSETIITYALNGEILASAPVDAGQYDISISFRMENGYKQLDCAAVFRSPYKRSLFRYMTREPVSAETGSLACWAIPQNERRCSGNPSATAHSDSSRA